MANKPSDKMFYITGYCKIGKKKIAEDYKIIKEVNVK
jgi:hypothetical protein